MPSRARRRRGYVEQLPSGSWRAVAYAGTDPLTKEDVRLRETCKTRGDAEKALTALLRQVDERKAPKSAITVGEAVTRWMEVAELEETTRDRYEDLIRLYVLPTFGDMQVSRVDAELLERFYARLHRCGDLCPQPAAEGPCAPAAEHEHHPQNSLRRPRRVGPGRPLGYLGVNPAEMAYAPAPAKSKPDPPTAAEAAALLNEAWRDPEWGLLLWLTMVTGCRAANCVRFAGATSTSAGQTCGSSWRPRRHAQV